MLRFVALLAVLLFAPALGAAQSSDEAAIRGMVERWLESFNAGDASSLSSLYAEDAVGMHPDGPTNYGREVIRDGFAEFFEEFRHSETAPVEEVEVTGDVAIVWGTWRDRATPRAGGDTEESDGDWMWVLRRQPDGQWLITRHISNMTIAQP